MIMYEKHDFGPGWGLSPSSLLSIIGIALVYHWSFWRLDECKDCSRTVRFFLGSHIVINYDDDYILVIMLMFTSC